MKNINITFKKVNKNYLNLFFIYSISHFWIIFLGKSLYWDDWFFFNIGSENIYNSLIMLGAPIRGSILNFFFPYGLTLMRFITFILFYTNAIFIDKILERIKIVNENNRFIFCVLFLVTPFYLSRITFSVFPYTLCLFLFFFAWFIYPRNKVFSLLLFFISFSTNSLLVFYGLPILEIILTKNPFNKKSIFIFFKKNLFLLILPFLYYFIKISFFRPYGLFSGYNENFNFKFLFTIPFYQINDALNFKSSLILFIPLIVLIFTYIFYKYIPIKFSQDDKKYSREIFILGILSLFLGLFPYWILGHFPSFNYLSLTRHQLLMPLGIGLIYTSILSRFEIGSRRVLLSLVVTISIIINQTTYFALIKDHEKQLEIISQLSNLPINENTDFVIFDDATKEDNAFNRQYRFYEWQGILNSAYPKKDQIIALEESDLPRLKNLFESNCQYFFGYKRETLPDQINISKIKISYKSYTSNNFSIPAKIYNILNNKGKFKKIILQEVYFKQISKKDINDDHLNTSFCEKNFFK